jgi:transposase-like protein
MVDTPPADGETLREIATRHGRAYDTLRAQWSRHPAWPTPVGKRGRSYIYDPAAVDTVIAEHFERPAAELQPGRLYTAREIAAAVGISESTIRAERSKGRWPAPDDTEGVANRWYGRTVTPVLKNRRGYRRSTGE